VKTKILPFLFGLLGFVLSGTPGIAADSALNKTFLSGLTLHGYDPVCYFDGKPMEGNSRYALDWGGGRWHFSSQANRERFEANPQAFTPQFGGFCAWAVSQGYTADVDPLAWDIVEGKLYLNYNKEVQAKWRSDREKLITAAQDNWLRLSVSKK
jgi:YHS domain-containing protein